MDAREFIESSRLQVLVPQATAIDIEEAFANEDALTEANNGIAIEQRSLLYFGGYSAIAKTAPWSYSFLGM